MSSQIEKENAAKEKAYDRNREYLPRERAWYKPEEGELVSTAPDGSKTKLPNPLKDPIVCNNIAYSEFDYTEGPYIDDELDLNPRS